VLRQIYLGYLFLNGVFWGTLLHGRPRIYTYIPDSLRSFISIDDFSSLLRRNGYGKVDARGFLFAASPCIAPPKGLACLFQQGPTRARSRPTQDGSP